MNILIPSARAEENILNKASMKKFTKSTLKSVLKNKECSIKVKSSFSGMTDCVESTRNEDFKSIDKALIDFNQEHTFGINGLWLVGGSRDSFRMISDNEVEVYNCCGSAAL